MPAPQHFITGAELDAARLDLLLHRAAALKEAPQSSRALEGRTVALVFQKPSTRTRTSFESGVFELGGHPMILRPDEMQLTRGESVKDTALVLSRHSAVIGLRTGDEDQLNGLAEHASVPVVNMLSPGHHPCQAIADLLTLKEALGNMKGRTITYVGDGNNVARSLAVVGEIAGLNVRIAAPSGYQITDTPAELFEDPVEAVKGADAVYTDVWVSMSDDESSAAARREALHDYAITDELLDHANDDAFALHCLPAHPGEEITESVLYGDRQRIWDQAENRRHAQKALLESLVSSAGQDG
jgi:ornithine carbamoyltransferase